MRKRELELSTFETFLHLGEIHFDRYELQDPPEPDIVARREHKRFGIEITAFHREAEKRRESEEDRIIDRALEIYNSRRGPTIHLDIMWAPHFVVQKTDRQELAERIAQIALRYAPAPGQWLTLDWRNFDRRLMTIIDNIGMFGVKGPQSHWAAGRGAIVPEWDARTLQAQLDRKRNKPRSYQGKYTEIWLLVVSHFGAPSSWMQINEEIRAASFLSPFDKLFVLSSFPHQAVELNRSGG